VPAFIFDRQYSVSGAQEVEAFVRIIDQVVELGTRREAAS
jgi:predicted DsbA family dithiol-disulfide isomerase